jgi:hypothetical protein
MVDILRSSSLPRTLSRFASRQGLGGLHGSLPWLVEGEFSPVYTKRSIAEHLLCSAELAQHISELCRHEPADVRC